MARLHVTLLGGLQLRWAAGPPIFLPAKKAQALLAYLAMHAGQMQSREKLATLLWGDTSDSRARHSLRQSLVALRRVLPRTTPPILLEEGNTVTLRTDAVDLDVPTFERLVSQETSEAHEQAVALYRGHLLEGLGAQEPPFEEWLAGERERLRELVLEALTRLLAHHVKFSALDRGVQVAVRLLALDPLQEAAHRTLMRLYARQGRRGAALRQYQLCVDALERELGVAPETETSALYQELLRARAGTTGVGGPAAPAGRPRATSPVALTADRPLIGRDVELERLRRGMDAAQRGRGQVAMVLGEAGIGKTRLVEELTGHVGREARTLVGRCHELEQILPFRPWIDALRSGEVTGDTQLRDGLDAVWRLELGRLLPEWTTVGAEMAAADDHVRLFEAFAHLVARLAEPGLLVLVLEDLHWADEMSLRLLSFLFPRIRERSVFVVGTARDEELAEAPLLQKLLDAIDLDQGLIRVRLSPLSEAETHALVRRQTRVAIDEASLAQLGREVWELSEGNPLVAVEAVRGQRESGRAAGTPGLELPERIRDLILSRLERLSAGARALADAAAVIGREFEFELLRRAGRADERETAKHVEELVARRVLHVVGEAFDFSHARVRGVAYAALLPPRRALLHRDVAAAIAALHAGSLDQHHAELGRHYAAAQRWDDALEHFHAAGRYAAARSAHGEAVTCFELALDAARHLTLVHPERLAPAVRERRIIELVLQQALSLFLLGRLRDVLDLLLEQRERLVELHDPALAGPYYFWLAHTYCIAGDREHAGENARRALDEAGRCHDVATMGKTYYVLAVEDFWSSRPRQGVEHGRRAVALLEGTAERYWLAISHWVVGLNLMVLGEFDSALEAEARTRAIGEAIGDSRLQSYAAWTTGRTLAARGEWAAAIEACRQAVDSSRDPFSAAVAAGILGYVYLEKADATEAIPLLERSVEAFALFDARQHQSMFTAYLSEAYLVAGDLDRATEMGLEGLNAGKFGHTYGVGWSRRVLGRIAQRRGDRSQAQRHLEDALECFQSSEAPLEVGRTLLALAEVTLSTETPSAAAHLRKAHELFVTLRVPPHVDRAQLVARQLGVSLT